MHPSTRPFTSLPLAIDTREHRVVVGMVANRVGNGDTVPFDHFANLLTTRPCDVDEALPARKLGLGDDAKTRARFGESVLPDWLSLSQ